MDDKMKAAFDAWYAGLAPNNPDILVEQAAEWTLDYLRSQQEPVAVVTYTGYEPDHRLEWLNGNTPARLGEGAKFYAHPIPSAPAVPEGLTPRYWRLIDFALWRLINDAYSQANFAAQGKDRLHWKPEHVGKFLQDAEDAGAARKIVMKAIADNGWTAAPSPTEKKENNHA